MNGERLSGALISVTLIIVIFAIGMLSTTQTGYCLGDDSDGRKGSIGEKQLQDAMDKGTTLRHEAEDYIIEINGNDIVNPSNELITILKLKERKNGDYSFEVNKGNPLPGNISIRWKNNAVSKNKYYYINTSESDCFEYIGTRQNDKSIEISVPGRYIVKKRPIERSIGEWTPVIAIGIACVMSLLVFFLFNKKYWFW